MNGTDAELEDLALQFVATSWKTKWPDVLNDAERLQLERTVAAMKRGDEASRQTVLAYFRMLLTSPIPESMLRQWSADGC